MHLIKSYIQNLMLNLPKKNNNKTKIEEINVVLDGGIFNGSYLTGALYFLKEMEKQNYLRINKISSCSISSVCALLYCVDALDLMTEMYNIILKQFKEHHNLNAIDTCFDKIRERISHGGFLCDSLKNRLFISYYDVKKGKKIVMRKYRNIDEIFETIRKSCFVPFVVDGNMLHKKRFFDGINPYIFPVENNRKTLYIDLFGADKIGHLFCVKNEKTNFHRILAGLLDIHLFYIKQCTGTQMCSYVNNWSLYNTFRNRVLKWFVEKCLVYIIYFIAYLKSFVPVETGGHIIFKVLSKIIKDLYIVLLENYCF